MKIRNVERPCGEFHDSFVVKKGLGASNETPASPSPELARDVSELGKLPDIRNPVLPVSFYSRNTVVVSRELLGKVLCHQLDGKILSGKIVETEAYLGQEDPASHASRGPTPRAAIMFGPPGRAYVYFIYGNHYCFNVVAHDGGAGAILVRALEPVSGIPEMMNYRKVKTIKNLTNGPGKLTQAMGITRAGNGADLCRGNLVIRDAPSTGETIMASPRVGIRVGRSELYRFSFKGNSFVSSPIPR